MGFFKSIKKGLGHIFDLRIDRWLNLKMLKDNTQYYIDETKTLFTVKQAEKTENFEQAVERLELSRDFIYEQAKRYLYLSVLFLISAFLLLAYSAYISLQGNLMGGCISFCLTFYALCCAFRFHFWYFQMKHQKLGCSIGEWFKSSIYSR